AAEQGHVLNPAAPDIHGAVVGGQLSAVLTDAHCHQARGLGEFLSGQVLMDTAHDLLPQEGGGAGPHATNGFAVGVSNPHRSGVVLGVAYEPLVVGGISGTRLTGHQLAGNAGGSTGTAADDVGE